ncbi:hypothetical protein EYC80_001862 [Monilinia laxa]|uniref:Uncharacterized protein n=1 Tax=Monilinia laxa TaxID=61186 RepID=A0A5N6K6D4_MONLA|nr:hypothetical protein EYC80_001862 [Monilinia laxa]
MRIPLVGAIMLFMTSSSRNCTLRVPNHFLPGKFSHVWISQCVPVMLYLPRSLPLISVFAIPLLGPVNPPPEHPMPSPTIPVRPIANPERVRPDLRL